MVESGTDAGVDLETVAQRMAIRNAVEAGDVEQALEDYHRAHEHDETFVRPVQMIADHWAVERDCDQAMPYLEKLVTLRPDSAVSYHNRGHCRYRLGDFEGALVDATTACDMGDQKSCRVRRKIEGIERWSEQKR